MTKQRNSNKPRRADLEPKQIKLAITRLNRRLEELNSFDTSSITQRGYLRIVALEKKYDDTLVEIFGNDTDEYERYKIFSFDKASMNVGYETPLEEVKLGYKSGIDEAITCINTMLDLFKEKIDDLGESPSGRALKVFAELDIHHEIERAVAQKFTDGHYADAIETGCKVLDSMVKMRSGKHDLSGTDLMRKVFSVKKPVLRFNDLNTETDKSEQQGMMHLYAGAMLALRNPRAHVIIDDNPDEALDIICFLSFLTKSLDKCK